MEVLLISASATHQTEACWKIPPAIKIRGFRIHTANRLDKQQNLQSSPLKYTQRNNLGLTKLTSKQSCPARIQGFCPEMPAAGTSTPGEGAAPTQTPRSTMPVCTPAGPTPLCKAEFTQASY